MIDVAAVRAQIPVCQRAIYLNTGWSGPSPGPVLEAIRRQLELESQEGPASPRVLALAEETSAEARAEVAALLGAEVDEVVLVDNTTQALNLALTSLPWQPGDQVLTFDLEHLSVLIATAALARRGVQVRRLPLAPNEPLDRILARVQPALGPATRLVCFSHVQYASGLRMPVAQIAELAHAAGAQVLVDGAQAVGQLAVDVHALGVDYYALPGQKWLLGPDGTGALFVRRALIGGLQPIMAGLFWGRFDRASGRLAEPAEDLRKFELSTSSTALRAGLAQAVRFVHALGLDAIQSHDAGLAACLKGQLAGVAGVELLSPSDPASSSALVTVRLAGVPAAQAVEELWRRWRIAARSVPELDAVRFSCHCFNTQTELDQVTDAVRRLVRGP